MSKGTYRNIFEDKTTKMNTVDLRGLITYNQMTLDSKLLVKNHKGHLQRIEILHFVHLNSGQRHFVLTSGHEAVILCWTPPCQGQVFRLRDEKKRLELDRIRICKQGNQDIECGL